MELFEELTSYTSALNCIEKKDWYRAKTVAENRIVAMLNAINDPRKMVGRVLAIYFYNKFVLGNQYIYTRYDNYPLSRFLNVWLKEYVSESVINELSNLRAQDIYPYVDDDEVLDMMQRRSSGEDREESHLGFFESKKLAESLFLTKDEISNRIKELKDEFPDSFEGAKDEDLINTLKDISIDYLDGCTDLTFEKDGDDNIVDITGNSTDILSKPEYKALMSKVFEGVVDQWLEEHNLTHGDICWFRYDPDTQQMFVEFDANNVDWDELEKFYASHDSENEKEDEELEEAYTRLALGNLEHELYNKFKENNVFVDDLFFEDPEDEFDIKNLLKLTYSIHHGDWKHDHLFSEKIVEEFAGSKNWKIINTDEQTIEDSDDDSYSSYHYYVFSIPEDKIGFFKEDFINEDSLDETYSEEELDDLVGKTFNQQKIQNIYRRNKYNDKRLFAHTKCINCGREKRLFLSNLVNDPEKYGSCVCSNTNVESRLDNIEDLFSGSKKLSTNTSGYTGVTYIKTYKGKLYDKWRAYIEIDGKRTYLGDFDSKSAAIRARKKAAEKGLKWYKEHKNEFMKNYRRKSKRYRSKKN